MNKNINKNNKQKIKNLKTVKGAAINPRIKKPGNPILFFHGYATTIELYKELFESLAVMSGRKIYSADDAGENQTLKRGDKKYKGTDMLHIGSVESEGIQTAQAQLQKAFQYLLFLEERGIKKVDAIGHSEGSIILALAAMLNPKKFRKIVFVNPVGMEGHVNIVQLLKRFMQTERQEEKLGDKARKMVAKEKKVFNEYILENFTYAWKEAMAIAKSDIVNIIKEVRELGIKVSIVLGEDDLIVPIDDVVKRLSKDKFEIVRVSGSHNAFPYGLDGVREIVLGLLK